MRFRLDREIKANAALTQENTQVKDKLKDLQQKFIDDEQEVRAIVKGGLDTEDHRMIYGAHVRDLIGSLCRLVGTKNEHIASLTNFAQLCEQEIQTLQAKEYDSCMTSVKHTSDIETQLI